MSLKSTIHTLALKRSVMATCAALVLAGSVAGVAGAQQTPQRTPIPSVRPPGVPGAPGTPGTPARPNRDQFVSAFAAKLGITVDRLNQALTDTRNDLGLKQGGPGPFGHGGHKGRSGPGGPGGPGGPAFGRRAFGASLDAAAQAMNITADQLRQELPGKTLTDVARARSVDPARVSSALKTAATTQIDQAVTAGRLTTEQATRAKQRAGEEIDQLMTRQIPAGQPGQPGQPRRPGQPGAAIPGAARTTA